MNDPITLKLNADKYIMMALEEDITRYFYKFGNA